MSRVSRPIDVEDVRLYARADTSYEERLLNRLCDEVDRLRAALRAARFVADHWRKAALQYENTRLMAHPLNLVLNALDGATDPTMLGIEPEAHDAFRAALGAPGGES